MFSLIDVGQARKRYQLTPEKGKRPFDRWEDYDVTNPVFLLHQGDLYLDDINLDWDLDGLSQLSGISDLESVAGVIIDGNLVVKGSIINRELEYGMFLFVSGDVTAKHLYTWGSEFVFQGDVFVEEIFWVGEYFGSVFVGGSQCGAAGTGKASLVSATGRGLHRRTG